MNEEKKDIDFDFDLWAQMAEQDPHQFEVMRQQMINDLIAQAPPHLKMRMEGLQWQVDQIRKQADNPLAACLQISQKMWSNVVGEKGLLTALQQPHTFLSTLKEKPSGKILSFDRNKSETDEKGQ